MDSCTLTLKDDKSRISDILQTTLTYIMVPLPQYRSWEEDSKEEKLLLMAQIVVDALEKYRSASKV
jgi:hypothetical protein